MDAESRLLLYAILDDEDRANLLINHRFTLHDNSMYPDYQEGDTVIFNPYATLTVGCSIAVAVHGMPTVRTLVGITGRAVDVCRVGGAAPERLEMEALFGRVFLRSCTLHFLDDDQPEGWGYIPKLTQRIADGVVGWDRLGRFVTW